MPESLQPSFHMHVRLSFPPPYGIVCLLLPKAIYLDLRLLHTLALKGLDIPLAKEKPQIGQYSVSVFLLSIPHSNTYLPFVLYPLEEKHHNILSPLVNPSSGMPVHSLCYHHLKGRW
ncbi:hypothetical protein RO3G_08911 [Rhizopus delemar RA 99-880]|uniref:Uncharacterized protein n=1 Tax=Rhizopus delemar (strain RA 99-880 / ATCC MYA-4621 / FGSC 9543 / NRRL 43880) TaxID=246409 RepID=I1C6X1_RHIO9|nr:hypothetical protein RO3G_08911 [Rhizopus delemar RA 99-880]|eukprot:EIE84201.1 hypothetical protein RO3G_08911 [Rhizopus delemar RA 99-880]